MHPDIRASDRSEAGSKQDKLPVWLYITIVILLIPLAAAIIWAMSDSKTGIVARPVGNCNLQQGPCQAVFANGGKVTLAISPRPIHELKQLHIQVRVQGIDAKSVYVDFRGENMYMGYNRPQLKLVAPGRFAGTWVLASCGLDVEHMLWQTVVLIQTARLRMAAPFMLETRPKSGDTASLPLQASRQLNLSEAPPGGDFTLTSASGPFNLNKQHGKVVLLYFGYTSCPDVCPTTLARIAQAFRALNKHELAQVEAVFVSVDPARDSPKKLAAYTKFFSPSFIGVTGTPVQIARVTRQYGAVFRKVENASGHGYLIDHSANTYVIAPDGSLNTILPDATPPQEITRLIRRLLSREP